MIKSLISRYSAVETVLVFDSVLKQKRGNCDRNSPLVKKKKKKVGLQSHSVSLHEISNNLGNIYLKYTQVLSK